MTAWTNFVKNNMSKVSDLPQRERLKKLSEMYKGEKPMAKEEMKPKPKVKKVKGGMMSAGNLKTMSSEGLSPLEILRNEMSGIKHTPAKMASKKVKGGKMGAIMSAGGLSSGGALVSGGKYNIREGHHQDNGGITSFYPDILM